MEECPMATAAATAEKEPPATRFAKDQLRAFIERVERLEEEKKALADDIKDVFAEAKSSGFDVKALKDVLKRRAADEQKLAEHEAILETYMLALGMLADTPLGQAAINLAKMGDVSVTLA